MPLSPLLLAYDHVLLDLDGCVWIQDTVIPGVPEALGALRAAGKSLTFITNDGRHSPEEYVRKLWGMGVQAALEEIVSVGAAIQFSLAGRLPGTAYVIGAAPIYRHVADSGQRIVNGTPRAVQADVVVVSAHDDFSYAELSDATQAVLLGAEMIAAGRDRTFPVAGGGQWPGTGALVAALEFATGRTARVVGKPDAEIFVTALDRLGPGRALMVGDRLESDLAGAHAAGLDAAIVLTGVSTRAQAEAAREPAPVAIAEDLPALLLA
ncbi:MAG TPA: HAD-IIA family hydrolase [Solirubrobacteraceae bacterium]|nr:HAD-IIA family hydrolase [Solirubrobacteraceae bacterium]